jgi:VWFA-related protein
LKAVDALIQFVRAGLLPQDRVAVYAYNRATDFTTDHEQIAQVLEQYKKVCDKIESWLELNLSGFRKIYGAKELPKSLQPEIAKIFEGTATPASRQVPPGRLTAEGRIVRDWDLATSLILGTSDRAVEAEVRVAMADDVAATGLPASQVMQSLLTFDELQGRAITLELPFNEFIPRAASSIEDMQNLFTCIEYLRYLDGEKHLLFFSGGGLLFPYGNTDYDKGIAAMANDARVAIDTFHTGGLAPTVMPTKGVVLTPAPRGSTATSEAPPPMGSVFNWGDTAQGQSLRNISAITGGRSAIYQDIGKALDIISETTRVQYLLGYYPSDDNWNGRYRQIQVKVNRPGLRLYFRRGYFARDKLQPYDRAEFLAYSRVSAAGGWSDIIDDVPFKISTSRVRDDAGQPQVVVDLKINASKIALKTADGIHSGRLRVAVFFADASQRMLGDIWKTVDLKLQGAPYQEYMKSGIPCSIAIPAQAGDMYLTVVVYDLGGDQVGSRRIRVGKR